MRSDTAGAWAPRTAVVTGAGSGIGRAVALAFADAGISVVLAGRTCERLSETQRLASGFAGNAYVVPVDVRDATSVARLFDEAVHRLGRLDVLFNNAGIVTRPAAPDEISVADWQDVLDTNLSGVFFCTREAFGRMRSQTPPGGRIINNGSVSAHVPRPGSAAYTATKHAVTGLTRATALDGRAVNIACSQIDVGNVQTEVLEGFGRELLQADGNVSAEPTIDVEHVARAVLYVATLPLDANVPFMTLMPTTMPFIGRG